MGTERLKDFKQKMSVIFLFSAIVFVPHSIINMYSKRAFVFWLYSLCYLPYISSDYPLVHVTYRLFFLFYVLQVAKMLYSYDFAPSCAVNKYTIQYIH